MSNQSAGSSGAPGNSSPASGAPSGSAALPTPPPVVAQAEAKPITQQQGNWRTHWPEWAKQLPRFKFPDPTPGFQLIDPARLDKILAAADQPTRDKINEDMKFLDGELLRF